MSFHNEIKNEDLTDLEILERLPLLSMVRAEKDGYSKWFVRVPDGHGAGSSRVALVGTQAWLGIASWADVIEVLHAPLDDSYTEYIVEDGAK